MENSWIKYLTEKHLYLIAVISVATLIVANQLIVQKMLRQIDTDENVAYQATRQLTLSQRIAKLSYQAIVDSTYFDDLKQEVEYWHRVYNGLQHGDSKLKLSRNDSQRVHTLFEKLNPYHKKLYTTFRDANNVEDLTSSIDVISENEQAYIPIMNEIIEVLEQESGAEIHRLEIAEIIIAVISLLILWLEFQFIFRPVINELQKRKQKLEKLNKSKDRILATVAHDIRNPLTGIQGTLQILEIELKDLDEEQKTMIQLAMESCKKAEKLIQELLDMAVLESENFHLQTELIHLEQYLKGVLTQFKKKADEKNIDLRMKIDPKSLSVIIDKDKFARVIENLITNALKFTDESGQVELFSHEGSSEEVLIEIRDTGIGIPDKLKEYIFDKFSRARRLGTQGESTTGLGMSIVKETVEKHGGKIWLDSQEGKGTVFYISLPKLQ